MTVMVAFVTAMLMFVVAICVEGLFGWKVARSSGRAMLCSAPCGTHQSGAHRDQWDQHACVCSCMCMCMYVCAGGCQIETVLSMLSNNSNPAGAYFSLLFISLLFVLLSATLVAVAAPHARGGGVPYVLAYLSGTNVMEYFSLKIVLVKTLALIFTISAGVTLGMEVRHTAAAAQRDARAANSVL